MSVNGTHPGTRPDIFEINWSRRRAWSRFYLAVAEPGGRVFNVARSPAFRWRAGEDPPQAEAITAAHAELVEKLLALGWEEVGSGETWYARKYRRCAEAEHLRQPARAQALK